MSGIGHLAAGLSAKPAISKVPLWVLLIAGETNDILYFAFTKLGIEQPVQMSMDFVHGVRYATLAVNPWSHGLFMSLVWSFLAAVIAFLFYRDRKTSAGIGLVVFSHWALDFLMHSNLPLFFAGSTLVGLGLENSGAGLIFMTVLDIFLVVGGFAIYLVWKKRTATSDKKISK